jgi:hypothetical protein
VVGTLIFPKLGETVESVARKIEDKDENEEEDASRRKI